MPAPTFTITTTPDPNTELAPGDAIAVAVDAGGAPFRDLLILVYYLNNPLVECAWDGAALTPFFVGQSSATPTYSPSGVVSYAFSLIRAGGWPSPPSISVHVTTQSGYVNP